MKQMREANAANFTRGAQALKLMREKLAALKQGQASSGTSTPVPSGSGAILAGLGLGGLGGLGSLSPLASGSNPASIASSPSPSLVSPSPTPSSLSPSPSPSSSCNANINGGGGVAAPQSAPKPRRAQRGAPPLSPTPVQDKRAVGLLAPVGQRPAGVDVEVAHTDKLTGTGTGTGTGIASTGSPSIRE